MPDGSGVEGRSVCYCFSNDYHACFDNFSIFIPLLQSNETTICLLFIMFLSISVVKGYLAVKQ
jgi:hypothetical protein